MQNISYSIQNDSDTQVFCSIKFPIETCENNCWFCSRLNKFITIDESNYKEYNQNNFTVCLKQLNEAFETNKTGQITFDYEVTFNHKYTTEFKEFFEKCVNDFNASCSHIPNLVFRLKIADDNLLPTSKELIFRYLNDIFPAYEKLFCNKEIRCEYSFDFDSRFFTEKRLQVFDSQYTQMQKQIQVLPYAKYVITCNHFVSILLPKTVRYVINNWENSATPIISFIKEKLSAGADLSFCLPFPMSLSVLQKLKRAYHFCNDYCYLTVGELRTFNRVLGLEDCPFINEFVKDDELFYCNINNGCKQKIYCKRYQLRSNYVNM